MYFSKTQISALSVLILSLNTPIIQFLESQIWLHTHTLGGFSNLQSLSRTNRNHIFWYVSFSTLIHPSKMLLQTKAIMGKMALRPKLKIAQSLNYCYIYKFHKYLSNITQIKEENDLKGLSTMWWTQTF